MGMRKREWLTLASSFVEIERKFIDLPFGACGSVYFKDVPAEFQAEMYTADVEGDHDSETFCIGPTADYMFWLGRRAGLDICRGPCEFDSQLSALNSDQLQGIVRRSI